MKQARKRLYIQKKAGNNERYKLINWAAENKYDTLVFSMCDSFFKNRKKNVKYIKLIRHHGFLIEAGGRDISLLLPRSKFLFNPGLFRMAQGRRTPSFHFCPTNPKTTAIVTKRMHSLIGKIIEGVSVPRVFNLLPDENQEATWCQCPACRAFRPAEQYMIAVNAAADALSKYDLEAKLAYIDFDTEPEAARVMPRKNALIVGKGEAF